MEKSRENNREHREERLVRIENKLDTLVKVVSDLVESRK